MNKYVINVFGDDDEVKVQVDGDIKVYVLLYKTIKLLMKKEIRQILFKK